MNKGLFSSDNPCWGTPQELFRALDGEFHFGLDAAATASNAKCSSFFSPEVDGLAQNWDVGAGVFCNPPYGREIGRWVQKAYQEFQGGVEPIVLLLPARTDTRWFHDFIYGKAELRFLRGRVRFTDESGRPGEPAPFPSMIAIYRRVKNEQR